MGKHLGENKRRQDILAASRTLFVEKGYATTSLEDIAQAAGISRGGMYFYYRNKQEILEALCQEMVEDSIAYLARALQGPYSNPHLLLEAILAYYMRYLVQNQQATALSQLLMEVSLRDQTVHDILARNMQSLETMLAHLLSASGIMSQGPLSGFDPKEVAALISMVVEGVKTRYLLMRDPDSLKSTVRLLSTLAFGSVAATPQGEPHGRQKTS